MNLSEVIGNGFIKSMSLLQNPKEGKLKWNNRLGKIK